MINAAKLDVGALWNLLLAFLRKRFARAPSAATAGGADKEKEKDKDTAPGPGVDEKAAVLLRGDDESLFQFILSSMATTISPDELAALERCVLFDVRAKPDNTKLPGARFLAHTTEQILAQAAACKEAKTGETGDKGETGEKRTGNGEPKFDWLPADVTQNTTLVLYCGSGNSSDKVAALLRAGGYPGARVGGRVQGLAGRGAAC